MNTEKRGEHLKRKSHFDLTSRQQIWRNKRSIEERLKNVQELCHRIGLEISNVTIVKFTDKQNEPIINYINIKNDREEIKSNRAIKALKAKDEANLSDYGYDKLFQSFKHEFELPTVDDIRKKRKALKDFFKIEQNNFGFYNKPLHKIIFICKNYIENNGPTNDNVFNIKLTGDSINVAKTGIKLFLFAFALLEEKENPMSVEGNYILGIFEIEKEDHESTKNCLKELLIDLKKISSDGIKIKINDIQNKYAVKFKLGGDLLFIANMLGLKGGNANYACPWCTANLKEKTNVDRIYNPRSYEEAIRIISTSKKEDLGYVNKPIIDFVNYDDITIDILHLLIRISEKIFDCLIEKINNFDKNKYGDLEDRPVLKHFHDILTDTCKIRKPFTRVERENNKIEIKMRSLNGNDYLKIFNTFEKDGGEVSNFFSKKIIKKYLNKTEIEFEPLFPGFNLEKEDMVWSNFIQIYEVIRKYPDNTNLLNMNEFREKLKVWIRDFLLMRSGYAFPYAHALVWHIPDMLEKHENINLFNQQGLEKLNDFIRIYFFRSTNKKRTKKEYLCQLLDKRNRIEFFSFKKDLQDLDYEANILNEGPNLNE